MAPVHKAQAGVIGDPVAHSKSPSIHNHWLKKYRIDGAYAAIPVPAARLAESLRDLQVRGFRGVNVTLPHKQAVAKLCTTLTRDAERIGAVNTVVFHPSGEIEGRNTDAYGFIENLRAELTDDGWRGGPVVILGAGGAARALIHALQREGVAEIRVVNRTVAHAEALADEFPVRVHEWDDRHAALADAALIVNATSLGMTGKPALDIDIRRARADAAVCDIVYAPLMTPLLRDARAHGCAIATGIGMLLHQARPAFQAFFGVDPEIDAALRDLVLA
jgi:shikimate dehydrogenase